MELRQLRYFTRIVEIGSMSRAAETLFIAQSALSQQVAKLEAGLTCEMHRCCACCLKWRTVIGRCF